MSVAYLHLRRVRQSMSIFRKFQVQLDGQRIDKIKRGVTRVYVIKPGEHELVVSIDWVSSDPVRFQCNAGENVRYVCGHPEPTWLAGFKPSTLVSSIHVAPDDAMPAEG